MGNAEEAEGVVILSEERIAELALDACRYVGGGSDDEPIRGAIRQAVAEAAEQCATLCDGISSGAAGTPDYNAGMWDAAARIQKAIRECMNHPDGPIGHYDGAEIRDNPLSAERSRDFIALQNARIEAAKKP